MRSPAAASECSRPTRGHRVRNVIRCGVALLAVSSLALVFAAPSSAKTPKLKKPGPPLGVTAVPISDGATISWAAPTSNGGSPITGYTVQVQKATCTTGGATSCTISGLTEGHNYSARVKATNIIGTGRASQAVRFVAGQSPDCFNLSPGANLRYCHLGNRNLDGYDLAGADLSGAGLRGTSFIGTNLDDAIFDGASGVSTLDSADFRGAQMIGAQFAGMFLESDDFGGANLTDSFFTDAVLVVDGFSGATMTGADLSGAVWHDVTCPDGTFSADVGNTCVNNLG